MKLSRPQSEKVQNSEFNIKFEGQGHEQNGPKSNQLFYRQRATSMRKNFGNRERSYEVIASTRYAGRTDVRTYERTTPFP